MASIYKLDISGINTVTGTTIPAGTFNYHSLTAATTAPTSAWPTAHVLTKENYDNLKRLGDKASALEYQCHSLAEAMCFIASFGYDPKSPEDQARMESCCRMFVGPCFCNKHIGQPMASKE